ncbi:MAG: carboxypeptidase-like regulatory domain-containing protein [Thermoguttaceae bacterium]
MMLSFACRQRGPQLGEVQGTVTLDGRPLARATVIFEPKAGGHASRAVTDASGRYQLVYLRDNTGALVGSHLVKVFTASEDDPKERIPARYNKQSTLAADVGSGANEYNVSMTSR